MTLSVRLHPEATAELAWAARWYDKQRSGLGDEFVHEVDRAIEHLTDWPHAAQLVDGLPTELPVRRSPIRTFPYHVAYLVLDEVALVIAIAHDNRRPNYWQLRAW